MRVFRSYLFKIFCFCFLVAECIQGSARFIEIGPFTFVMFLSTRNVHLVFLEL